MVAVGRISRQTRPPNKLPNLKETTPYPEIHAQAPEIGEIPEHKARNHGQM
jgi:hypothetical protein